MACSSASSRLLPIPASPMMETTWPRPEARSARTRDSSFRSWSRPTSGRRERGEDSLRSPTTRKARTGSALPLRAKGPTSRRTKRSESRAAVD